MHGQVVQNRRKFPFGAEVLANGQMSFRVWAPKRKRVEIVELEPRSREISQALGLEAEGGGVFSVQTTRFACGALYGFRLDGHHRVLPDPCSRFQPDGPLGPSQVVDSRRFTWTDRNWQGISATGQVIYEMHVGTFTPSGNWSAACAQIAELARTGITVVQVMPIAEFPGRFGWGYDGVFLFAPTRNYGTPDDFRRFVDTAHAQRVGVILDVVYNHWGPFERCLEEYSDQYHAPRRSDWGDAPNYDGPGSAAVRELVLSNVRYWIEEFHLDGLRLDATQAIVDSSPQHIVAEITTAARTAAPERDVVVLAENEPQELRVLRAVDDSGWGCDWIYNDDFHHAARVCLTGSNPAYYSDYQGTAAELVTAIRQGFIYQGQYSQWQKKPRGTCSRGIPPHRFVTCLQNHDQIANQSLGERLPLLCSPARLRAMTALWLLSPQTPLIFQGQEFAATAPFLYFADFSGELAADVTRGRIDFLSQFPTLRTEEMRPILPQPCQPTTFARCKLDLRERQTHASALALHADLLQLRRVMVACPGDSYDAAVLGSDALALRYFGDEVEDRLIVTNFGPERQWLPVSEPLLAPPAERRWELIWHSQHPRYGGPGFEPHRADRWKLASEATFVLVARRAIPPASPAS